MPDSVLNSLLSPVHTRTLWGRYNYYHSHSRGEKTEAQASDLPKVAQLVSGGAGIWPVMICSWSPCSETLCYSTRKWVPSIEHNTKELTLVMKFKLSVSKTLFVKALSLTSPPPSTPPHSRSWMWPMAPAEGNLIVFSVSSSSFLIAFPNGNQSGLQKYKPDYVILQF